MIHDRQGSDEHNRDVTRRLAGEGYAVLLVDQYSRSGGTEELASTGTPVYEAAPISTEAGLEDLNAGLDWLKAQEFVSEGRLGAVGFCMGGRFALLMAEGRSDLVTTVVYYGILTPQGGVDTLARVGEIRGTLLGHFGEVDRAVPLDSVRALQERLREEGVTSEVHVYPNAGHAFNNDRNPQVYRPEAARLAWSRTLEWLERELADPSATR
jgi:carboxymethylenebutenolidase